MSEIYFALFLKWASTKCVFGFKNSITQNKTSPESSFLKVVISEGVSNQQHRKEPPDNDFLSFLEVAISETNFVSILK